MGLKWWRKRDPESSEESGVPEVSHEQAVRTMRDLRRQARKAGNTPSRNDGYNTPNRTNGYTG